MWIVTVITLLSITIIALYSGLTLTEYKIESEKVTNSFKFVLISDLHNTQFGKNQSKLMKYIKKCSPDFIAVSGDMIDNDKPPEIMFSFFYEIKKLGIPVYYVTGNHEESIGNKSVILKVIKSCRVKILNGELVRTDIKGNSILIGGISDPIRKEQNKWEQKFRNSFRYVKKTGEYSILLSHRPELFELYSSSGFDLALSGHAHGGQVRIPKLLNGLYAPHQGLFPKYSGGIYIHGKMVHIVSRGASVCRYIPRVFNPPEIISVCVSGKETQQL